MFNWLKMIGLAALASIPIIGYWAGRKKGQEELKKAKADAEYQRNLAKQIAERANQRIKEKDLAIKQRDRRLQVYRNPQTQQAKDYAEQEIPEEFRGFDE